MTAPIFNYCIFSSTEVISIGTATSRSEIFSKWREWRDLVHEEMVEVGSKVIIGLEIDDRVVRRQTVGEIR